MDHLFSPGVGEEVGHLILCDYDANLMHRLWSKQEILSYSPNTVEEIVVSSWLSSLSIRALKELLKIIFPSTSPATTPPRPSMGLSSTTNLVPVGRFLPRESRLFLSAF